MARETTAIQIPNRSLVTGERSQTIAGLGPPDGRGVIFGGCKEKIAIVVVFDGGYRTFVSLGENGSLRTTREQPERDAVQ